MAIAIFDFDGTLVYAPSSLVWSRSASILNRLSFPLLWLIERVTGISIYQKKVFEWLVGKNIKESLKKIKGLPPVPEGLKYFKELSDKGYRMIVMSYSPGIFVQSWLDAYGLSAELICPDFDVSRGVVTAISNDEVTDIYLNQPKAAKRDVIGMLNIMPSVSVGDNHKRDVLCDNYKKIQKLQPKYKGKVRQVLSNLRKIF
ncbi:MAG: haloacid dehalogenase-like hydrolase [Candidatus Altiarchaeota archaeon]|nr:haloacid dehalogenase-like hydrolase [Candidatus Altiarchaeota archaeon]